MSSEGIKVGEKGEEEGGGGGEEEEGKRERENRSMFIYPNNVLRRNSIHGFSSNL